MKFETFGVTGDSVDILGEEQLLFQMGKVTFNHLFLVCKMPTSADGIIGLDFLTPIQVTLDWGSFSLRVGRKPKLDFVEPSWHETLLEECKIYTHTIQKRIYTNNHTFQNPPIETHITKSTHTNTHTYTHPTIQYPHIHTPTHYKRHTNAHTQIANPTLYKSHTYTYPHLYTPTQ